MNYTKGKWEHEGDGIITAVDGKQIAAVFPRDRLANAHLIAAAPDMYEALSEVLGYAEEYGGMAFAGETGRTRDYFLQAIDKSQKALFKAEGK